MNLTIEVVALGRYIVVLTDGQTVFRYPVNTQELKQWQEEIDSAIGPADRGEL